MVLNQTSRSSARDTQKMLTAGLLILGVCLGGYILGPPLYWHFIEAVAALTKSSYSISCPTCDCDCDCDCDSHSLLSIPKGLINTTFTDCAKQNPELSEETRKNFADLQSEELKLREAEALEKQQQADKALLDAKKLTSQYQKEADKCNSGMEACEEAREKAEAALVSQKKLTAMWEQRALQRGWKGAASAK